MRRTVSTAASLSYPIAVALAQTPTLPDQDLFRVGDEVRVVSTGSSSDSFGSLFVDTTGRISMMPSLLEVPNQKPAERVVDDLVLAEQQAEALPNGRMREEALRVIVELSEALATHEEPPRISPSLPEDGSFVIELLQEGVRAGFTIEPEEGQSGWYFASLDGSQLVSASGSLAFMAPAELLKKFGSGHSPEPS